MLNFYGMYTKDFRKYLIRLLILTAVTWIISVFFKLFAPEQYVSEVILFLAPFFLVISAAGRILLEYLVSKNSKWLNYSLLGIRAAKFFIYIIVVVIYAFLNKDDAVSFILAFFIFYLIYTYFDIKSMYPLLRKNP